MDILFGVGVSVTAVGFGLVLAIGKAKQDLADILLFVQFVISLVANKYLVIGLAILFLELLGQVIYQRWETKVAKRKQEDQDPLTAYEQQLLDVDTQLFNVNLIKNHETFMVTVGGCLIVAVIYMVTYNLKIT